VTRLSQWFIMVCLRLYCISITKMSDMSITVIYHGMSLYCISITKMNDTSITVIYHGMSPTVPSGHNYKYFRCGVLQPTIKSRTFYIRPWSNERLYLLSAQVNCAKKIINKTFIVNLLFSHFYSMCLLLLITLRCQILSLFWKKADKVCLADFLFFRSNAGHDLIFERNTLSQLLSSDFRPRCWRFES
jgi:hypothetical protein